MNDDEAKALYDRATAVGFKLEPGCRVWLHGELATVVHVDGPDVLVTEDRWNEGETYRMHSTDVWCDFRERASLGCLLGQVREAWGKPGLATTARRHRGALAWETVDWCMEGAWPPSVLATTEAEALVTALEAAPRREVTP